MTDKHCLFWYNEITITTTQSHYIDNYSAFQLSLPLDLGIKIDSEMRLSLS